MGVLVKSGEYALAKLVNKYKIKANRLIEISDEEARLLELTEYHGEPEIEPTGESEQEAQHDYSKDYLTFEAIEDCKFSINNTFYYSIDNGNTWDALQENEETPLITAGNKILWKCQNPRKKNNGFGIGTYNSTGKFNIEGNIMSLINGDNFINTFEIKDSQFEHLFQRSDVVNANNLIIPNNCTARNAFRYMFNDCILLTKAPELLTLYISKYCYAYMFYGCASLKYIKCLAKGINDYGNIINYITSEETYDWVSRVNKSGTFIKYKDVTYRIGSDGIPNNWLIEEVEE